MNTAVLTPAYGRQYKSAAEARKAFASNKDFILNNVNSPWAGKPANRAQLAIDFTHAEIRYGPHNRALTFVAIETTKSC